MIKLLMLVLFMLSTYFFVKFILSSIFFGIIFIIFVKGMISGVVLLLIIEKLQKKE